MKVILKKRVPNLGHEWDVINVKDGYARNYLLPNNLAEIASPKSIKMAEKHAEERLKKQEEIIQKAEESAAKLKEITLNFKSKANDGKLYGSIAEKDIAEKLSADHKMEIGKERVKMDEHIKTTGEHSVAIQLTPETKAEIKVIVEEE
jgi:large subunit ribosomal protein L9